MPTKTIPTAPRPAKTRPSTPLTGEAAKLAQLAADTADSRRRWDPRSEDLSSGRNAHHSNTAAEMRAALEGDHNWLEGDLRVNDDGDLVMAHDADKEGDGLAVEEWLAIGGAGQRGMKIDVKEYEAMPKLLDAIEASGIPDGRIMLNYGAGAVSTDEARDMRRRFPDAWMAINPSAPEGNGDYDDDALRQATDMADAVGGRVAFPIRWDIASDEAIQQLKPHGKVSIWTANSEGTPDDTGQERQRLLDRGVDGVIDLGPPQGFLENLQERAKDLWNSGPVGGVRDGVGAAGGWLGDRAGDVRDGAGNLLDGAGELGGDILSGAGDALDDAPLVGRFFGD